MKIEKFCWCIFVILVVFKVIMEVIIMIGRIGGLLFLVIVKVMVYICVVVRFLLNEL